MGDGWVRPLLVAELPPTAAARAVAHYVTDEQMHGAGPGRWPRALCGRAFRPACLLTPLGPTCPACRSVLHPARRANPGGPAARHAVRRRGLRRILALRTRRNR